METSDNNASENAKEAVNEGAGMATKEDRQQYTREILEREYGGELIKYKDLQKVEPDLAMWLNKNAAYGNVDAQFLVFRKDAIHPINKSYSYRIIFFTGENGYHITYQEPREDYEGYIGCVMSSRKARVGETWTRGSDFPDGKCTKETFDSIFRKLMSYEIKNLQCW